MGHVGKNIFRAEREEKISLFPVALWRICFYFCTLKPPAISCIWKRIQFASKIAKDLGIFIYFAKPHNSWE